MFGSPFSPVFHHPEASLPSFYTLPWISSADAGDERGCDFVGLHHIGVWVDDLGEAAEQVKRAGGTFQSMEDAEIPIEHAEHKYRDPFGVVIDVSTRGWDGARRDV